MYINRSLSALISPSLDGKSRNIVSNIWDWDVVASWDDGATWAGWNSTEKSPGLYVNIGGGGVVVVDVVVDDDVFVVDDDDAVVVVDVLVF